MIEKLAMFQIDLASFVATATVHAEIKRQDFRQLEAVLFQGSLDREQFSLGREGFVPGGSIDRALGDTVSALSTGQDIVRDLFKPFWHDGYATPKDLFRDKGEEFEQEPLRSGHLEVKDAGMEKHLLKRA